VSAAEPHLILVTSFWRAARWAAERVVRLTAGSDVFYGTALRQVIVVYVIATADAGGSTGWIRSWVREPR